MKRLVEMGIAVVLALVVMTLACGCGKVAFPTTDAATEAEVLLVSETAKFAQLQSVSVRGEITERHYPIATGTNNCTAPAGCEALGWYNAGVAYYNRAMVEQHIAPHLSYAPDTANHEVCHAKNPQHDLAHWSCMDKWANPTYAKPAVGAIVPTNCGGGVE